MLDWHLGMAEGGDGVARSRLAVADAVTLARFWLVPALPAAARSGAGLALSLTAVFGRARRPAIRARPWGALLRVAGLALCAAGRERAGTPMLVAGCAVPPRSTAPQLSPA